MAGGSFALELAGEIDAVALVFGERLVFFEELDRDDDHPGEVRVLGFPDFAHPPRAKAVEELVTFADQRVRRDGHSYFRKVVLPARSTVRIISTVEVQAP